MAETEMIERVARELEPQAWAALGAGDTLAYKNRRTSSLRKARAAIEAMRGWQPIETVPKGVFVDVWVVDAGDEIPNGSRWTDVKVLGSVPYLLVLPNTDSDGDLGLPFHPAENGVWISHWMERPAPPSKD